MDANTGYHYQLKSFGLTHFQYQQGDHPNTDILVVMETTVVLSRREVAGILLLLGQLANEAFNLVLKQMVKIDRPNPHLGDGYGMPSSHSQFMGFFVVYVAMFLETRVTTKAAHKLIVQVGAIALCVPIIFSRVYLGYHTFLQVLVGSAIGLVAGFAWYQFIERAVYPSGIWLLIRDSQHVVDIAQAEYDLSHAARAKAKPKSK
ncbi:phosphatidic acid phosphatase type 2/haloperoxidase [Kickxella alabastrina]|uniref:phosphatidic acid phosphatase type 2/haloperoxidase n=1 Tax=Kickxella alabastrina TaxID=61397 RepID=UPI002220D881|nr:phosphatidic acid phosphatase type 2/haloperoxidase [Kickxella alabastrina]KAI7833730.1 phosphatidic acid phosphatase type 2/haloperoxidase [Kickxella alabastrina]